MEENPGPDESDRAARPNGSAPGGETSLGTTENVAGLLAYLAGWFTGIIFLLIEKENSFVRFHAMQSIVVFVPITVASIVLAFVPVLGGVLSTLVTLGGLALWLLLMLQAFRGIRFKLPYAGDYAESQLKNRGSC